MTLEELRKQWEKGLEVKSTIQMHDLELLVILEKPFDKTKYNDPETIYNKYHCHRYFLFGRDNWEVSVDGQSVSLDAVWNWLNDPRAISRSEVGDA